MKFKKGVAAVLVSGSLLMAACNDDATENKETNEQQEEITASNVLEKEIATYQDFAIDQMDQFVVETEKFVELFKAGDIEGAKAAYAPARMYFERSEPIAESFGDLDPRIDGRLADLEAEGQSMEDWSGYHKLEYALWEQNTTAGYEAVADQLLADVKELYALIQTVEVTPELLVTGAVDLLNEVSTSKITGEEEIYSHTDLYDFKANVEGAEEIFNILRESIKAKDETLVATLEEKFATLNDLLAKYETAEGGYVSYLELTEEDTKALAQAVNELGEPLSQMGIVIE